MHSAISAKILCVLAALTMAACAPEPLVYHPRAKSSATTGAATGDDDDDDTTAAPSKKAASTAPSATTTTTASTVPTIDSTKGSGGPTGDNTLVSAAGLSFIINVPTAPATKPRGLLVLLHGSEASNYTSFVSMMENVATQYDLIRVSVLAPDGQGWNEGDQQNAAALLHQTIQQDLFAKYDIDKSRVIFSGQSSGGGFLSSDFLPAHAKDYRGGAFMQCGAAPPDIAFTPDAATKLGMKLHFVITTGDTIWPQSYAQAVTAYTDAGMTLTQDNTEPGDHCAFDQQQIILSKIASMLPP